MRQRVWKTAYRNGLIWRAIDIHGSHGTRAISEIASVKLLEVLGKSRCTQFGNNVFSSYHDFITLHWTAILHYRDYMHMYSPVTYKLSLSTYPKTQAKVSLQTQFAFVQRMLHDEQHENEKGNGES